MDKDVIQIKDTKKLILLIQEREYLWNKNGETRHALLFSGISG